MGKNISQQRLLPRLTLCRRLKSTRNRATAPTATRLVRPVVGAICRWTMTISTTKDDHSCPQGRCLSDTPQEGVEHNYLVSHTGTTNVGKVPDFCERGCDGLHAHPVVCIPEQIIATGVLLAATIQARNIRASWSATHRATQHYLDGIGNDSARSPVPWRFAVIEERLQFLFKLLSRV